MSLRTRAWLGVVTLAAATAALLFLPAGTVRYWQGWVYLVIFVGVTAWTTFRLSRRDRALLERRMRGGPTAEKRPAQRIIMAATSVGFIALLVIPALDHRFGWSSVAPALVLLGDALVVIGFLLIDVVYAANTFTAATVQVFSDQRVISTGPYAVVRHPMYGGGLLYLVGTPLALGSYWGLLPFAFIVPFLLWRLFDEERLLEESLPGYHEYEARVRHRLVPGVW